MAEEEPSGDAELTPLAAINLSPPEAGDGDTISQLEPSPPRRRKCSVCDRPTTVCICAALPSSPISTSSQIVILHHPHESRHKLATVPLLSKCLRKSQTLIGRRLRRGSSPLLDSLHDASIQNPDQSPRAVYLFPGTPSASALPITQLESLLGTSFGGLVLIVFDGTWKHAREMVTASMGFLSRFAIRVSLECDDGVDGGSIFDSELILRKEPFGGCVSTMEAVARALRVIEPNGVEIEDRMLEVLRAMVRFQACHLKPLKPRPKMGKKSKFCQEL